MREIALEKWKSDKGNREDHYFMDDSRTYVFGYNPKLIGPKAARAILEIVKKELHG